MNQQGRIVIPAEACAAAGIQPGDELLVDVVGEGEAQAIVARYVPKDRDLVAQLIAERRAEAARE